MAFRRFQRQVLGFLDKDRAVRPVPGRDLVPPPQLARDAPRLDVAHPLEIGLVPVLRHEDRVAILHRGNGGLGQFGGIHIPLLGQPRLDHHVRSVAMRNLMRVRLDLLQKLQRLEHRHDPLARLETVKPMQRHGLGRHNRSLEKLTVLFKLNLAELIQNVDLTQVMPLADFEVVEVMGRRDLDSTRALLRVGVFIADDRNETAHQRQLDLFADQMLELLVLRVHGHADCRPASSRAASSPPRSIHPIPRLDSADTTGSL